MKGCYSDSCILYSEFYISLFRGLRFKPDEEIGPSITGCENGPLQPATQGRELVERAIWQFCDGF